MKIEGRGKERWREEGEIRETRGKERKEGREGRRKRRKSKPKTYGGRLK